MPRISRKPWFRAQTGWWMCTFSGKQYKLVEGRSNKKLAEQKFLEFMLTATEAPVSPDLRVHSLCDLYLDWAAQNLKPRTYEGQKWYLQSFAESCGPLRIDALKTLQVTHWLAGKQGWGDTTCYNARRIVKRVMNWGVEQQILSKNPLATMKLGRGKNRAEYMSDSTYHKLISAACPQLKWLLFGLKQTGARPSELYNLKWDNISEKVLCIQEHKTRSSTGRPRTIYLSEGIRRLLGVLQKNRSESEHVFLNTRGRPWNTNSVQLSLNRLRKKLGIEERVYAYGPRHAFATNALIQGENTATVAELMGHKDTTMIGRVYGHLDKQQEYLQLHFPTCKFY